MRYYIEIMAALLFITAILHVYWALGGRWGVGVVLPTGRDGKPAFQPGMGATFTVAALLLLAGLLLLFRVEIFSLPFQWGNGWSKALCFLAMLVFAVRGVGAYCLILSRPHSRPGNWKWDLYLFSPICLLLAIGFAMAWLY